MTLLNQYIESGNYLFRKRSFIPLVLYVLATAVLLFDSQEMIYPTDWLWSVVCLFISLLGLAVRIMVVGTVPAGTSGRNTRGQLASTLNTRGIYSIVRHPLYLGNFLMWLGLIVYVGHLWFSLVAMLLYWIYYERIMFAEENFLKQQFGEDFERWASKTPAFIPALKKWTSPDLDFSVRKVIRREYRGLVAVIFTFVYLNLLKNFVVFDQFRLNPHWQVMLVVGITFFLIVRLIKKTTNWLEGRSRSAS